MSAPELRHFRYFCAVADTLHFGRAAARLGLSQPPLSLQIQQLEAMVGARLFDRHNRRVSLTDAGKVFYEAARRLLQDADRALEQARQAGTGEAGILRVAFGPTMIFQQLPGILRQFRHDHPGVQLVLREQSSAEQLASLAAGDLDVAFARQPEPRPGITMARVAREPLRLVLDRDHRLARRARVPLALVATDPWVLFPPQVAPRLHAQVLALCRTAGFSPRVVQESRETYTSVGLVGAGVGVTIVPAGVERMRWPGVVYKPLPGATTEVSMLWGTQDTRPVVERFVTCALAVCGLRRKAHASA